MHLPSGNEKNLASHYNSQVFEDSKSNLSEYSKEKRLLKGKRFPYDVFSPIFTGVRKAPPPTLKITKKRLQVVTSSEEIRQRLSAELAGEFCNSKATDGFLPRINPLGFLKHQSTKSLSSAPTLLRESLLLSRNELLPTGHSETPIQFLNSNSTPSNKGMIRLKPLIKYVVVKDKPKKTFGKLGVKSNPFVQKLNLLKGAKRLKYAKDKVRVVDTLDRIEEDEESIINVTFGK
eukprot:TRINITY_DN12382_c0_g3_i12.p1 TRINITY_DN12382_c0_g3~~TRINITY_DN12382_c0_g3_i12.p1  ORF type:complete len:233 (-),score=37.08 TRINITY_DN12382_c0_g3_i12:180-878(-)